MPRGIFLEQGSNRQVILHHWTTKDVSTLFPFFTSASL